jgi:hypothetical protein
MSQPADPISSPEAYRASLLAALGGDDPAVAQGETPAAIQALIVEAGDRLRTRPEPGEWSALECIGHIFDSEVVVSARVRWILAEDEPDIVGYDQALWVAELRHNEDDPALLLRTFEDLRGANLDLWALRSVADRQRVGRHRERGPESYDMTFRLSAGHDRIHLAQARRALDDAGAA